MSSVDYIAFFGIGGRFQKSRNPAIVSRWKAVLADVVYEGGFS